MKRSAIAQEAWELQAEIWRNRVALFPMGVPPAKVMLEPEVACKVLGYDYQLWDGLGSFGQGRDRFQVAGSLNQQDKVVAVSTRCDYPAMRFTGAHEVGHIVLGHDGHVFHRDRPVFELQTRRRDPIEQEADYFAACFLAPERLVREAFKARFLFVPLPLSDDVVFNLCKESSHALMRAGPGSLEFASAVASSRMFNGRHFKSMCDEFGISISSMAIRIQELGLLRE